MDRQTVEIYIAGSRFRINHEDAVYVKRVASIVDKKISELIDENEGVPLSDNMILAALDICDDMLAAQERAKELNEKNEELKARIRSLEREVEYFKNPKFTIPAPVGKSRAEVAAGQLCFPMFEERANLQPAVNGLNVATIRKTSKGKKN